MKKTLVAVAAMAAVSGAMADVTISGFIDQAVQNLKSTSTTGVATNKSFIGNSGIGQDALNFGVTEDIGGGMTAYANANFLLSTSGGQSYSSIKQDAGSGVGLKGAFGDVMIGQGYNQIWKMMSTADASGWGGGSTGTVWGATNTNAGSQAQTVFYTLPTMVQGLSVSLDSTYGNSTTKVGNAATYGVSYTTGGLMLGYAYGSKRVSTTASYFSAYNGDTTASQTSTTYDGTTVTSQAYSATYDLGVAKIYYGAMSLKTNSSGDAAESKSTYGISAPFGAVNVGIALSNAKYTNPAATSYTSTGYKGIAKYSFSKRTIGYASYGTSSTSGGKTSISNTSVGLIHNF